MKGENMFRFKSLFSSLPVCLGIIFMLSASSSAVSVTDKPEIFVQLGHQSDVRAGSFSADGKYLATGSKDRTVKLWDVASGSEIRTFAGHTSEITAVAVSSSGGMVVSGDEKGIIKLWDTRTGQTIRDMSLTGTDMKIWHLSFSPEGRLFSALSSNRVLTVWEVSTGQSVKTVGKIRASFFTSPGETYAATDGITYQQYSIVELSSGSEVGTFRNEKSFIDGMSFSQDGRYGLFMSKDYQTKRILYELFDRSAKSSVVSWSMDEGRGFYQVVLSPDGSKALSVGIGGIKLWDAMKGRELKTLTTDITSFAAFSPDGRFLISAGLYAPTLWDASTGKVVRSFMRRPLSSVYSAILSPDNRQAVTSSANAPPLLWDITSGKTVKMFEGYAQARAFIGDGKYVLLSGQGIPSELWDIAGKKTQRKLQGAYATSSRDGHYVVELISDNQLNVWEAATGKVILNYAEPAGKIGAFAITANNRYLLAITGNVAKRIEIATGTEEKFSWAEPYFWGVAISPDGRFIAVIVANKDFKNTLKLYDVEAKREVRSYEGVVPASSVIFSPDGRQILFSVEKRVVLCDVSNGIVLKTFTGHTGTVWDLGFSPGGEQVVSAGVDRSIRLWDSSTGKEIMTFPGHTSNVRRALLSPNGKQVISTVDDNTTRLWDIATGKEQAKLLSFTDGEWIIITPEGYYNASANGEKYLNVRNGNNVYGIEN